MKVKELIERLQKCDQNATVLYVGAEIDETIEVTRVVEHDDWVCRSQWPSDRCGYYDLGKVVELDGELK